MNHTPVTIEKRPVSVRLFPAVARVGSIEEGGQFQAFVFVFITKPNQFSTMRRAWWTYADIPVE